jgi:hypothetical protein
VVLRFALNLVLPQAAYHRGWNDRWCFRPPEKRTTKPSLPEGPRTAMLRPIQREYNKGGGKRHTNRRPGFANNAFPSSTLGIHKNRCAALFAHVLTLFSAFRGSHNYANQSRMLRGASLAFVLRAAQWTTFTTWISLAFCGSWPVGACREYQAHL